MNRKKFIASILPASAVFSGISTKNIFWNEPDTENKVPPYLKENDTIGICCVAGFILYNDILPAINKIKEWGFEVKIGNTVGKKDFTFGGTDAERLQDFQQMLDDTTVKAILCARGGYGLIRIIDKINFTEFSQRPKWIIGFSDVTVLHCHIHRNYGIATIHSKMCNSFPENWNNVDALQKQAIESIYYCLVGKKTEYYFSASPQNCIGIAVGKLIGGNLKMIETLAGTASDINTTQKILFVEDTDEYLYSIDRMFWNLKRTEKLSKLKALIIGNFNIKKDEAGEAFGKSLEEIVLEKTQEYNYPVCFNFPVGHQKNNVALKCGVQHQLIVQSNQCTLTETA